MRGIRRVTVVFSAFVKARTIAERHHRMIDKVRIRPPDSPVTPVPASGTTTCTSNDHGAYQRCIAALREKAACGIVPHCVDLTSCGLFFRSFWGMEAVYRHR